MVRVVALLQLRFKKKKKRGYINVCTKQDYTMGVANTA